MTRLHSFFLVSIALFVACAGDRAGRTALADGSYKLECRKPLGDCLALLTDVCKTHGYDMIQGTEERSRTGVEPVMTEYVTSHAIVRCRTAKTIFGSEPSPSAHAAASARPLATPRCFPGTTQACLGPGACQGAQTCRDDGAGFSPCDCGGASAVAGANGAGDAGPPPTWAVPPDGGVPP